MTREECILIFSYNTEGYDSNLWKAILNKAYRIRVEYL